jgi:hypothetical protein
LLLAIAGQPVEIICRRIHDPRKIVCSIFWGVLAQEHRQPADRSQFILAGVAHEIGHSGLRQPIVFEREQIDVDPGQNVYV